MNWMAMSWMVPSGSMHTWTNPLLSWKSLIDAAMKIRILWVACGNSCGFLHVCNLFCCDSYVNLELHYTGTSKVATFVASLHCPGSPAQSFILISCWLESRKNTPNYSNWVHTHTSMGVTPSTGKAQVHHQPRCPHLEQPQCQCHMLKKTQMIQICSWVLASSVLE